MGVDTYNLQVHVLAPVHDKIISHNSHDNMISHNSHDNMVSHNSQNMNSIKTAVSHATTGVIY